MQSYTEWYNRVMRAWKERQMMGGIQIHFGHDGHKAFIYMREDEIAAMNQWMKENDCEIEIRFKNNSKEGVPNAQGNEGTGEHSCRGPLVRPDDGGLLPVSHTKVFFGGIQLANLPVDEPIIVKE